MGGVAAGLGVVSGIFGIGSQIAGGVEEEQAQKKQEAATAFQMSEEIATTEYNAQVARRAAIQEHQALKATTKIHQTGTEQILGTQRTAFGAAGVQVGAGATTEAVRQETERVRSEDLAEIRRQSTARIKESARESQFLAGRAERSRSAFKQIFGMEAPVTEGTSKKTRRRIAEEEEFFAGRGGQARRRQFY